MTRVLVLGLMLWLIGGATGAAAQTAPAQKTAKPATASAQSASGAAQPARRTTAQSTAKKQRRQVVRRPARPSEGQLAGLHRAEDPLDLRSSVALVVDQDTDELLFEKNPDAVLPIASITKLMTALVTLDAGLPLDEELVVTRSDRTIDRVASRLVPGVKLTRDQALHLALMSSENHAAQLLGRTYPGGVAAFVEAMNAKAQMIGMHDSRFADPTGLSPENRSSPGDLVRLVKAAYEYDVIRDYSVSSELTLPLGKRVVRYGNTNRLTSNPNWDIGLQKTGFISAAGRCLVMSTVVEGQRVVMVLLDSFGKYSRIADAQRIRDWLVRKAASATSPRDSGSPMAATADVGAASPL